MAQQQIATTCVVSVDGTPVAADVAGLLTTAVVDDSLNLPDFVVLRYRDPDHLVIGKAAFKIGGKLAVSVARSDTASPEALFEGEITALEADFDAGGSFTVIRAFDVAHRLFRGRRTETYTQVTASDVATTVAKRAGLATGKVDATSTVFDHVSQASVSDWDFLDALAREIGHEVAVRQGKLDFCKPQQAAQAPAAQGTPRAGEDPLVLRQGTDLLRFRAVVTSAEQVKEVQVRGWDVAAKEAVVATAAAETTSAVLADAKPADLAKLFGDPVHVATDVPYRSQAEVEAAAKALADSIAGVFAEVDGVARGNPKLRAASSISLAGLGSPFDGKYVVTRSRHVFDAGAGYQTHFAVTGRQERSLFGLSSGIGAASARRIEGVVIAQVSDVRDPQDSGRVKLTFPWMSDSYVSDWARTVQPGAGKDRGATIVSEVGDEVLVAFEQGDVRRPYVLGGLYNGLDTMPPGDLDLVDSGSGSINRRSMVSRNGHRVDLHDEDGRTEGISIRSGDKSVSLLLDSVNTKITVHSDGQILIEGPKGVTVDAGSSTLELKAGDIKLSGTNGVTIDGGGSGVKVSANGELSLTGINTKLEGSGQTEVKGGALAKLSAAMVQIN
jgi:phage protein D